MNLTGFYRAFEERFYAPRSVIKQLRKQYLPYVTPLAAIYPGANTFDVGCGRGEWLELMQESNFTPMGVDLDEGMLEACRELGLPAEQGDAIAYLQTLADESQVVITAFHVVEHIPFEQLQTLVIEALRVLKPGGLLIMETPNPENIVVATRNFHLDPTHLRPLTPMLLGFLPEFHGYARVATVRLQEPQDTHTRTDIKLTDVLHHVSPDYAVVAQKGAADEILHAFDAPFTQQHGLDLHNLANRFDQRQDEFLAAHHQTRQSIMEVEQKLTTSVAGFEALKQQMDTRLAVMNYQQVEQQAALHAETSQVQMMHSQLQKVQAQLHALQARTDSVDANALALQTERDALRNSLSWKITAPLRGTASFLASPIVFTMDKVLKNQRLSEQLNELLLRFPSLHARLRVTAVTKGLIQEPVSVVAPMPVVSVHELSPKAKQIHAALLQEITHQPE